MGEPGDPREELVALSAMARELVEWEETLSGTGFPEARREAAPPAVGDGSAVPVPKLRLLAEEAAGCVRCGLSAGRTKSVFARGSESAEIAFVGEGPGYHEDQQGLPFVGKAGQLLDKMVAAMGYGRDEVYVANVVKCRPPDNRTPLPNEIAACLPYLEQQLDVVQPRAIVALGKTAALGLGVIDETTRPWRGVWREWRGIPVMATYHPAFLLRSPEMKRPVWEDLQQVMARLGKPVPAKR